MKSLTLFATSRTPSTSPFSLVPEDITHHILSFLSEKDLLVTSLVSRLFYFGSTHIGLKRFSLSFGGRSDPSLPRSLLFRLVDRADSVMSLYKVLRNSTTYLDIITAADSDPGLRDLFLWCSMRGYLGMMKKLVAIANAAPTGMSLHSLVDSKQPTTGATALILACEYNQFECAHYLSKSCAVDHTAIALNGLNAFHVCARLGHLEILSLLLEVDKSLAKSLVQPDGRTALHLAVCGGHVSIVQKLLDEGVDPDAATTVHDDTGNETSLHIAAYLGHVDILSILLSAGANPNVQMRNGRTPLLLACEVGWKDIAMLLLTRSFLFPIDLSLTTDSGKSALYCAIESGIDDLIEPLLESGSNALQSTRRNKTPFYLAAEKCNLFVARLLLENADELGTLSSLVESAKAKINNKGMKELVSLYMSPNGSPRNRSRGRALLRAPTSNEMARSLSTIARSPSISAATPITTAAGAIGTNSESLVNSAVMAAFVFTGGSSSTLNMTAASVLRRAAAAAAAGGLPGGGLPRSTQGPLVLSPAARQHQQQLLAQQNPSVGPISAIQAVLSGAGGNTAGEVMIRERARREAEEASAFRKNAELLEKHRREGEELAEKARKRLEERSISLASNEAALKAEAESKRKEQEEKRAEKDRQIKIDFLKRAAERDEKDKAILLSLSPPRNSAETTLTTSEGMKQVKILDQPSPKLSASPNAAKLTNPNRTRVISSKRKGDEEIKDKVEDSLSETSMIPVKSSSLNISEETTVVTITKNIMSMPNPLLKSTSIVAPRGNVVVMRAPLKEREKEKLELKVATFGFSI